MKERVYCANCEFCVIVRQYETDQTKYMLRVRCTQNQWRKRSGEEKWYKMFTVGRRVQENCASYSPMGEEGQYMKSLKKGLPVKDEIYTVREAKSL